MPSLEAILERKARGLSQSAIANELGVSLGAVAGKIWRYKNSAARDSGVTETYPSVTKHEAKPMLKFPTPQIVTRPENTNSDLARWESERNALLKQLDYVRVMHLNDLHLPFHDLAALELWYTIAGRFQPHIVVVGSDMLDLPTISRFERDPDIDVGDWHYEAREYYWPIIGILDRLLPKSIFVWINGNHERRAIMKIKTESSPILGMDNWRETVRCGGRVLHVGRTEHVEIGSLIVSHGDKTGKTAADKMGLLWPTKWVNFGHIHKHLVSESNKAFSSGKLCKPPFYNDNGYPIPESSGTTTMTVDTLPFGGVSWTHHNFVQTEGAMWTQYGDGLIQVDDNKQAGQAAA